MPRTRLHNNLIGIYPGSFDPITNGHLDLIERGSRLVDRLIVAILRNEEKRVLFSIDERMEMLREVSRRFPNVEVARLTDCWSISRPRAAPPLSCAAFAPSPTMNTSCRWR